VTKRDADASDNSDSDSDSDSEEKSKSKSEKSSSVLATLGAGDYFGEAALITNNKRGATITAKTKMKVLHLDRAAFEKLFGTKKLKIDFAKRNAISAEALNAFNEKKDRDVNTHSAEDK
jgi:CRP-like cAMP-binding protein